MTVITIKNQNIKLNEPGAWFCGCDRLALLFFSAKIIDPAKKWVYSLFNTCCRKGFCLLFSRNYAETRLFSWLSCDCGKTNPLTMPSNGFANWSNMPVSKKKCDGANIMKSRAIRPDVPDAVLSGAQKSPVLTGCKNRVVSRPLRRGEIASLCCLSKSTPNGACSACFRQ